MHLKYKFLKIDAAQKVVAENNTKSSFLDAPYVIIDLMLVLKRLFIPLLGLVGIVVVSVIFIVLFKKPQSAQKKVQFNSQIGKSTCRNENIFITLPIDPVKLLSVTPLGNINPPDHTTPTDHVYLVIKVNNEVHPDLATKVFAPADLIISTITKQQVKQNGKVINEDYTLDFSPCKDIKSKFGHVTKLSPGLVSLFEQQKTNCQTNVPRPENEYTYCRAELNFQMNAGEEMGEAGGGSATGLDFWAIDMRTPELTFANPKRYNSYELHTICAIDLFAKNKQAILKEKFGRYEKRRTLEPLCGKLNQDVVGTVAGNWMTGPGFIEMPESWSKSISFVHDNVDPNIGILSIGGTITIPMKIQFNPVSTGTTNREFSQVQDAGLYCYEGQSISKQAGQRSGRVLVQLSGSSKLKVEYQSEDCSHPFHFLSPTLYQR